LKNDKGFTLIEMMIVMIIIGILASIVIPNFMRLQHRAKEASVKANMHTLQLVMEDFATRSDGIYPDNAGSTTPGGETVESLCPGGAFPNNPFSDAPTVVSWDADPAVAGGIGINPANTSDYLIKGFGRWELLALELTSGS
jgi:prepilin-type N-terminal cleavage/methylation domain-containing protein